MPYVFITPVPDAPHLLRVRTDPGAPISKLTLSDFLQAMRAIGATINLKTRQHVVPADRFLELVDVLAASDTSFPICPTQELLGIVTTLTDRMETRVRMDTASLGYLHEHSNLYPFQCQGVVHLENNHRTLLLDDMGLGKTVQALMALPSLDTTIVVCPAVMKSTWEAECKKWRPDLRPCIQKGREFVLPGAGELAILNYEVLPEKLDKRVLCKIGTIIADEAHYLKNAKAERTKRFRALSKHAQRVWLLTGTPLLNKPKDMWGVLQSARLGREAYGTWHNFCDQWGGYRAEWGYQWSTPKPSAHLGLQRVSLRRTKQEVLPDLPIKTYRTVRSKIPKQLKVIDDAMKVITLAAHATPDVDEWKGIHGMSEARGHLANAKLSTAIDLVEQYEESRAPVVVFSAHKAPIHALGDREGWGCIHGAMSQHDRDKAVLDFQDGKLRGLACTIQAAGVGITLTRASHMIFIDRDWSPALNSQAEDRICRIGQTRGCVYTDIISDHPLDELLAETLQDKKELIGQTVDKVSTPPSGTDKLERLRTLRQQLTTALTETS